ncbi:MAG: signal peptidase I [Oscillospiraceae bacterium]|jgi:signal peptidase|nr:signal peptidase I [Oscillospiraceae bacterium]
MILIEDNKAEQEKTPASGKEKVGKVLHYIATAVGIVLCVVLLPIVIVNMTLVIKSYVYPDKVPTFMGYAPLIVQSGSMEPAIGLDDLIITKEVPEEKLAVGDVVAYLAKAEGPIVTHRITAITVEAGEAAYTMQGDANNTPDEDPVKYSQVVGKYIGGITDGGQLAMFMKEPIGMVIFVGIPLALFLLYDGLRRHFYKKKEKAEQEAELAALRAAAASTPPPEAPDAPDVQ